MSSINRLNSQSKKLFLQCAINKLSRDDGCMSLDFFKFLLINNGFIHLAPYSFGLRFDSSYPFGSSYHFCLHKTFDFPTYYDSFRGELKTISAMLKLLRPEYLIIRVENPGRRQRIQLREMIKPIKGLQCKIALSLDSAMVSLLDSWSSKISKVLCQELNSISNCVPLRLDYLRVRTVNKDDLIKMISQHKIKTLEISVYSQDQFRSNAVSSDGATKNVGTLRVRGRLECLQTMIEFLLKSGVRLTKLESECNYGKNYPVETVEEMLARFGDLWQKVHSLKEQCRPLTRQMTCGLSIGYSFVRYTTLPENWIQAFTGHDVLKNAKYEEEENFHKFVHHSGDDFMKLELKFYIYKPAV